MCVYIYIWDSRCAVVRYDTVLRRTRQCSNRSRLIKFWTSKVTPHLAIMGELWGVFVRYMYKNDCDTSRVHYISLSTNTGMKLSYKRIWYIYFFFFIGVIAKYISCVINATYLCFIAPAPFDVKYINIRNCHLNDICSRLEIEGPIS